MAIIIFPTVNDVGGSGQGKYATESNLVRWLKQSVCRSSVIIGFTVPGSDPDLTIAVDAGEAIISGYFVKIDTSLNVTVSASAMNHVFLQLTRDGSNNVTGIQFVVNTSGIEPVDSVKIFTCIADVSAITSTLDARPLSIFDGNSGHAHTGLNGDGPKIDFLNLLNLNHKARHAAGGADALTAADIRALPYIVPGDTILYESLGEVSGSTPNKVFRVPKPGRYRITGEVRTSNASNAANFRVKVPEAYYTGTGSVDVAIAATFSTTSTSYVSFSVDMNTPISKTGRLYMEVGYNSNNTMYMRNIRIRGIEGAVDGITQI